MGTFLFLAGLTICQSGAPATPPVICLDARPDGTLIAAGSGANLIFLSRKPNETAYASQTIAFGKTPERITALAFSPDGKKIAVASGVPGGRGSVRIVDGATAKEALWKSQDSAHKDLILSLAWSADGNRLASSGHDRLVLIHDVAGKKPPIAIRDHSDAVTSVAFLGNTHIASAGYDRVVKIFDAQDGKRRQTLAEGTDWLYAVAVNPTNHAIISGGKDKLLRLYRAQKDGSHTVGLSAFAHSASILQTLISADGKRLCTLGEDRTIKTWNPDNLTQIGSPIALDALAHRMALAPDQGFFIGDQNGRILSFSGPNQSIKTVLWPLPPAPPKITRWTPNYLLPGQPARVQLEGTGLNRVQLTSSRPGIKLKSLAQSETRAEWEILLDSKPMTETKVPLAAMHEGKAIATVEFEIDRFARMKLAEAKKADASGLPANRINLSAEQVTRGITLEGVIERAGHSWNIGVPMAKDQPLGIELIAKTGNGWTPELECIRPDGTVFLRGKTVLGFKADQAGLWEIRARDELWRSAATDPFRLEIGPIPVVLGAFPRVLTAGSAGKGTAIRLLGVNLPATSVTQETEGTPGQKVNCALGASIVRPAGKAELTFSATKESIDPSTPLETGMGGQFLLTKAQPQSTWNFRAKKGEPVLIRVEARRHGSPLDPYLEILDGKDQPVGRARLQSIAKTNVTFRDHDANAPGIRIDTWGDLQTNDFLLAGNELLRIRNLPRNPDDDCQFYKFNNKRKGYLGTTPVHHPNGQEMFRVRIHPPKTPLPENGMPNVDLAWFNDDGDPEFDKDSQLLFEAPQDGVYRARITDSQGQSGDDFFGRLVLQAAKPDFRLKAQRTGNWVEGSAALMQVTVERLDGFQGPIELQWREKSGWNLPAGRLGEDDDETILPIGPATGAGPNGTALQEPLEWTLIGTAHLGKMQLAQKVPVSSGKPTKGYGLTVRAMSPEIQVKQGGATKCSFEIVRPADFKGRIPIEFKGLPFGCKVLDIGLNGILMIPGETKRTVEVACEDWVKPGRIPFVITARQEGKDEVATLPLILEIIPGR